MRTSSDFAAAYGGLMVSLGSKLGLYKAMAGAGPISSRELAARAGCAERYLREWLNAQAASGYISYHATSDTYELSPKHALVLADEDSPVYIPGFFDCLHDMGDPVGAARYAAKHLAPQWHGAAGRTLRQRPRYQSSPPRLSAYLLTRLCYTH